MKSLASSRFFDAEELFWMEAIQQQQNGVKN